MRYLKTFESHSTNIILYRGTNKKLDFIKNDMVWASEEEHEASGYGKYLYELEVDLGKCFNSLDIEDIKVLYDNGCYLYDSYYDDDEHEYDTAEDFCERGDSSDTWSSIEDSGAVDYIKSHYDSILITEGGYTNYILFNGRILNYKEITPISEKFEDTLDGYYEPISLTQKDELIKEAQNFTDNEIRRIKRVYPKDIRVVDYEEKGGRQLEIRGHDSVGLRTRDTITKVNHGYYIVSCINDSDIFKCDQFDGLIVCLKNLMDGRYNKDLD